MVEVPVPSEVMNVLNFLALDLILLPYIMHISGRLAGFANKETLKRGEHLKLVVFDPPVVGGGIVMARSTQRSLLIAARLSAVLAVAVCNFGLEGRSRVRHVEREALVRVPGPLAESFDEIYLATERRMRCSGSLRQDMFYFGAVLDDHCYPTSKTHVYVQGLSFDLEPISTPAKRCTPSARCLSNSTVYRCKHVDFICGGVEVTSGCPYASGVLNSSCVSVVYSEDSDRAWLCGQGWLAPADTNEQAYCRGIIAKRKDIDSWVDYLWTSTFDPLTAIFASAYGKERREIVSVPEGELLVTIIRIWWFIPTGWVILVAGILSTNWLRYHCSNVQPFAHDERGLTKLLRKEIDTKQNDENIGSGVVLLGDQYLTVNLNEIGGENSSLRDDRG